MKDFILKMQEEKSKMSKNKKMQGKKNSIITGAWALGRISYLLFDAANTQEKKL